jgi:tetratricopeptide (TPR) repeat protein
VQALRTQRWIPLAKLIAIRPGQYEEVKGKLGLFYAQSWILVHYLTVAHPANTISYAPTLPSDLAALEKELRSYVSRRLPTLAVRLRGASVDSRPATVRAMTPAAAFSVRASAILYSDRPAAALSLANQALFLNSVDPLALEVKGISYFLSNQRAEARKWLELAASQPSASFRAHYYYGVASADTPAVAEKHLKKALELKPGFKPALQRMGYSPDLRQNSACACQ